MKNETLRGFIGLGVFILLAYFGCRSCNRSIAQGEAEMEQLKTDNPAHWRLKMLDRLTSADGSIYQVKYAVADMLKDPSSFEHISTTYQDNGNLIDVRMRFRGKNSFGALVPHEVTAVVDIEGRVVSIGAIK